MPRDRVRVLLLVEKDPPRPKPGLPALGADVLAALVDRNGPLEEVLRRFAEERPSTVEYQRVEIAHGDARAKVEHGVHWLPQVRLVRGDKVLLRSQVQMSSSGHFLVADVGGRSYRRRGEQTLIGAITAEIEKKVV